MKKSALIVVGVVVVIIVIVIAVILSSGEKQGSPDKNNNTTPQENDLQPSDTSKDKDQGQKATGEIVGQIKKNGVPIPEFSVMKEVVSEQGEGNNFKVVYGIAKPESRAIKTFYQNNLGDDWSLKREQSSGPQTFYTFNKGENYTLKVVVMKGARVATEGATHGLSIDYEAPYQEDPYPDAVGVAPTSDKAEKYHQDFSSVFENIFGGVKLENTEAGDWIDFDYVVKRPITQEDATEIRNQLEEKGYDTKNVSKDKHKAEYTFRKSYGDWNEITMEIKVGEYISNVQQIKTTVWNR